MPYLKSACKWFFLIFDSGIILLLEDRTKSSLFITLFLIAFNIVQTVKLEK